MSANQDPPGRNGASQSSQAKQRKIKQIRLVEDIRFRCRIVLAEGRIKKLLPVIVIPILPMQWLTPFRLILLVQRRFRRERFAQTAAALSFTTLLGLVPMIVVAASLIDQMPFAAGIVSALKRFLLANLLPEKAGAVIAKVVGQFADRAERVKTIGVISLGVAALIQMLTIEHAFNTIWKVASSRSWVRRILIHGAVLALGPLIFGGSLVAVTYVASASFGLIDEVPTLEAFVLRSFSLGFLAVPLVLAYWGVPNKTVSWWHAGVGGIAAAGGFVGLQKLFAAYVVKFPTYTLVYGPFAALPIFLIWLYASWTVILLGALITAEFPQAVKR